MLRDFAPSMGLTTLGPPGSNTRNVMVTRPNLIMRVGISCQTPSTYIVSTTQKQQPHPDQDEAYYTLLYGRGDNWNVGFSSNREANPSIKQAS